MVEFESVSRGHNFELTNQQERRLALKTIIDGQLPPEAVVKLVGEIENIWRQQGEVPVTELDTFSLTTEST